MSNKSKNYWLDIFNSYLPTLKGKKVLLHSCCAPCSTVALSILADICDLTIFYYNPNIYPHEEYLKRKEEQIKLIKIFRSEKQNIDFVDCDQDSDVFVELTKGMIEKEGGSRCSVCFKMRLQKTFEYAKENNFNFFATTLTVSPYKNSEVINSIGLSFVDSKVKYIPTDFKKNDGYKRSIELSKQYSLYRQHYCGCVFSFQNNSEE